MPVALRWLLVTGLSSTLTLFMGLNFITLGLPIWLRKRFGLVESLLAYAGLWMGLLASYLVFNSEYSLLELALNAPITLGLLALLVPWFLNLTERTLYRVIGATLLASLMFYPIWTWVVENPVFLDWSKRILTASGLLPLGDQEGLNQELFRNTFINSLNLIQSFYAALLFVLFTLVTGLATRLALPPYEWPLLIRFRLPQNWIYGLIIGLLALSWSFLRNNQSELTFWEMLLTNVGWIFILLYVLNGLGILYHLAGKKAGRLGTSVINIGLTLGFVLTISLGLWQYIQPSVVVLSIFGASETWIKYRD
jgi:hypothetical protein